jgi:transposase
VYWTTSDGIGESKEGYRIIWCKSSQKAELDADVREAQLRMAQAELYDLGTRINKGKLKTRPSIKKAITAILKSTKCKGLFDVRIATRTVITTKRLRPGRPKADDPVREIKTKQLHLVVSRDKKAIRAQARQDGVFPLLTNLAASNSPRKEVILIYKYQPYIEKRHALFKTELGVHPVYIKKPRRAAGLIHATFLAMMLDALIERTIRLSMEAEGIESLPIYPEGRHSKTPTTARVLEMFSDVSWYEYERGGETTIFPVQLTPLQREILRLLGMDEAAYV